MDEQESVAESPSQIRWRSLLAWGLLFGFLGLAAVFLAHGTFAHLARKIAAHKWKPVETPIVSKTFLDGAVFEVLRAENDSAFRFESRRPEPLIGGKPLHSRNTYRLGIYDFETSRATRELDNVDCRLKNSSDNALFLLVRLQDPAGKDLVPDYVRIDGIKGARLLHRDAAEVFDEFRRARVPTHPDPEPLYQVEIEDGSGGWIPADGPFAFDGLDGRSVVIAPVFPRRSPELNVRVLRQGTSSHPEASIPNPGYDPAGFPAWTLDPKPWVFETSGATVQVNKIGITNVSSGLKARRKVPNLDFRVRPHGEQSPEAYRAALSHIEDETGNRSFFLNFRVLPGKKALRYHGTIERTRDYQWSPSEVTLVAEGVWTGDVAEETLTLLPGAVDVGMEEMTLGSSASPKGQDWQFAFRGETPKTKLSERGIVIILDEEDRSSKTAPVARGRASDLTTGDWAYHYTVEWDCQIAKGQKIRVGIVPEVPAETFEAILPVPPELRQVP